MRQVPEQSGCDVGHAQWDAAGQYVTGNARRARTSAPGNLSPSQEELLALLSKAAFLQTMGRCTTLKERQILTHRKPRGSGGTVVGLELENMLMIRSNQFAARGAPRGRSKRITDFFLE